MTRKSTKRKAPKEFDKNLAANAATLRRTAAIPKGAAILAVDLLGVVAKQRGKKLTEYDAVIGAVAASLLTTLATGTSRAQFVAWLRRTATTLATPKSSAALPNHSKGN